MSMGKIFNQNAKGNMMTGREKLRRALRHEDGPVPFDLGSTGVTGMHVTCVAALRAYYGLEARPVKLCEPYQMLGWFDDDLLAAIGADMVGLSGKGTLFGFRNDEWTPFRLPWGQEVLVSTQFKTTSDGAGGLLIYPQGDATAPPSGHLPAGGFYFDAIIRQEPIDEDRLDPADNLEEFSPISDQDLADLEEEKQRLAPGDRALIGGFGILELGNVALVPAPFLKYPRGIRDITEWYISTAVRRDYLHQVFARQTEIALENLARLYATIGDAVDTVYICGTDFGTQSGTFCAPATFRELYAPYYRQVNDWIHAHTPWKTFKHSCGAVAEFIPEFIDVGFDILNPVQCSAAGMSPQSLKAQFGAQMVFWGGGVDTQYTLPFATPAEVRAQVLERCRLFSPDGGFVFSAVHNIQANTPVDNIVAMIAAVREFNGE